MKDRVAITRLIIFVMICCCFGNLNVLVISKGNIKNTEYIILLVNTFLMPFISICSIIYINSSKFLKDELTEVYTKSKLYLDLKKLMKRNVRFTLVYIDLNDFKSINDTNGHVVGDKFLKSFGSKIKLIAGTRAYRYGGDEFVLVSRLNENVLKENLSKLNLKFNFSYGMSTYSFFEDFSDDEVDRIIGEVDEMMYLFKMKNKEESR